MHSTTTDGAISPAHHALRIVGIGASAGGLSALEQFLEATPPDTGLAYIVVQHMDPFHKCILSELLQKATTMPVTEAQQNMKLLADHVYVIAPNTVITVEGQHVTLARPAKQPGMRLPINTLFSSLATAHKELAIGVVLSGMGTDGTAGLQAIKTVGGLTLAQDPQSAEFDSMPLSAIATNCVDIVAPASELPSRILSCIDHRTFHEKAILSDQEEPSSSAILPLESITNLLHQKTGHDFSLYKTSTLHRRIERRMVIHNIQLLADYLSFLQHNSQEVDLLFKELLIGVTSFFRDSAVWDYLKNTALPTLIGMRSNTHAFRAWCVGCSTGEEAYSLAILFTEVLNQLPVPASSVQIFASDLSPDAIASARQGQYPLSIDSDVPAEYLERYFSRHDSYYQIKQSIRDMVLFAQHDVIIDPPFTKLDLIVCRNLMIYFSTKLQHKLLPVFHYSLCAGGILLLGSSETIGPFNYLFSSITSKYKLYRRRKSTPVRSSEFILSSFPPLTRLSKDFAVPPYKTPKPATNSLQSAADHILLQTYSPAAVVINAQGDIVYISGRTGKYLEPAAGKANWNFHAMVREGLRTPIYLGLNQAAAQTGPLHLNGIKVKIEESEYLINVTVQALQEPAVLKGMTMVVFHNIEAPTKHKRNRNINTDEALAHEAQLQQYRNEIEALRSEANTTKEELQSSYEELQSTNEELQSTNEELTTSKEEMQSMNEELQTINTELQAKLDDLALAQSDMQNILNSIEIAILFLDQNLNVRRYTDRAANIINLRESDLGRPLSDLSSSLQYPDLINDAATTLRTLSFSEKELPTDDGRWFSVRIMPYRRLDNVIDGVVITMVDTTHRKNTDESLDERLP